MQHPESAGPYGQGPYAQPYQGAAVYQGAPPPAAPYGGYPAGGAYAGAAPPFPPMTPSYGASPVAGAGPYVQQPADSKATLGRPSSYGGAMEMSPNVPADPDRITEQISVEIRHAFVRKVFAILAVQILITFGVAAVCGFVPGVRSFILAHYWVCIVAVVLALVLQLVLVCIPHLGRKVPTNFLMMTLITLCYSVILGYGAASSSRDAFLIAIGTTFVVVVGLMLFACQTKYDFTGCGTYIFVSLLVLLIFGLLLMFFSNRVVHLVYSGLATLLFCLILVYDTQLVVGGKHRKFQYSVDDYIFAALTLYLDIIIIFMEILSIADNV